VPVRGGIADFIRPFARRVAHVQNPSLAGIDRFAMEAEVEDSAQRFD